MNEVVLIFYTCILTFLGASILDISKIFLKKTKVLLFSIGFGVGIGIVVVQMFLYSWIGIDWSRGFVFAPWLLWFILYVMYKKRFRMKVVIPNGVYDKLFFMLLGVLFLYVAVESQLRPVLGWDAVATWFMMGKGFFIEGAVSSALYHYLQIDNPPGMGILLSSFYLFLNHLDDQSAILLFSVFYVMILCIIYGFLRELTSARYALFSALLLGVIPSLLRQAGRFEAGYADLPVSYFFLGAGVLLQEAVRSKRIAFATLGMLLSAIATFFKNEALPFFLFYIVLYFLFFRKSNYLKDGKYIFLSVFTVSLWQGYKLYFDTYHTYYLQSKVVLERVPTVLIETSKEFFNITRWNILWIFFFLVLFIVLLKSKSLLPLPTVLLTLLQLFVYFTIFIVTPLDPIDHFNGSFDRLLLQITPLAFFSASLMSYTILKGRLKA